MTDSVRTFPGACEGIRRRPRLPGPLGLLLPGLLGFFGATGCVVPPGEINEAYKDVILQRHTQYQIKEGDVVKFEIASHADDLALNQSDLIVLPDGRSDLFNLSNYRFLGRTVTDVEQDLTRSLALKLDVEALDIRVQVIPAGETVYLSGEFRRPAAIALGVKMTLQETLAAVGGTLVTGDTDWALLARPYGDPVKPGLFRIDLNNVEEDIYLLPGDRITLQRNLAGAVVNYLREFIFGILPTQTLGATAFAAL